MISIPKTFQRWIGLTLVLALALLLGGGCSLLAPEPKVPMPSETLREAGPSGCTAILLPGRWNRMEAFREQGFGAAVDGAGLDLGLVAADAHIGYYREESVAIRLAADVVGPLLARRTEMGDPDPRAWLAGISLGGVGSILYARDHPEQVAGLVLIAPFLGEEGGDSGAEGGVLEELRAAGSLAAWRPAEPVAEDDFGRRIWLGLREVLDRGTPVLLAYGTDDDLSPGHELLARELPAERVFRRPGGHDWPIWTPLWADVLASGQLCGAPRPR
jgi:pimeloyl-ACP methyl ester carboxylesterase